jgi:hypothetical protein
MKKILIVALIGILLAVALVGCGRIGCDGDGKCSTDGTDKKIHIKECSDDDCAVWKSGGKEAKCDC